MRPEWTPTAILQLQGRNNETPHRDQHGMRSKTSKRHRFSRIPICTSRKKSAPLFGLRFEPRLFSCGGQISGVKVTGTVKIVFKLCQTGPDESQGRYRSHPMRKAMRRCRRTKDKRPGSFRAHPAKPPVQASLLGKKADQPLIVRQSAQQVTCNIGGFCTCSHLGLDGIALPPKP